jgi:hypothetical protein
MGPDTAGMGVTTMVAAAGRTGAGTVEDWL